MTGGYWYLSAGTERFCWAKTPTFVCPFADGVPTFLADAIESADEDWGGAPTIERLGSMWHRAHGGFQRSDPRARVDGKLTDRCSGCGAKLDRKGFAAWQERDRDADDSAHDHYAGRMGLALVERIGETRYFPRKRRAEDWARRQIARRKAKA